jgi:hypothetical protein
MTEADEKVAAQLLTDRGLGDLLPVHRLARRPGCTLWKAELFSPYGDAAAEIQIYPLGESPVSVVDMEEEITALLEDSAERVLAHKVRDEQWGILVTCGRKDAPVFRRFFKEGLPKERTLTYHPQLDRILGGDYFRDLNGRWIKACLSSIARAMEIRDLVEAAEAAYAAAPAWEGKLERPLPALYAILEIPALELPGAPEAYNELAMMQFGIATPEPVEAQPPVGREQLVSFARQLFGLLAAEHRESICFSRDAGSCLRPEFLLADGSLSDVYFLCKPEPGKALKSIMDRDIWNALTVTCELARRDIEMSSELLSVALTQYIRQGVTREVSEFVRAAAEGHAQGDTESLTALLKMCFRIASV